MKKRLFFLFFCVFLCLGDGMSASRVGTSVRQGGANQRVTTSVQSSVQNVRKNSGVKSRTAISQRQTSERSSVVGRSAVLRPVEIKTITRAGTLKNTVARAGTGTSETQTGAIYERCKTAYFTCMDQFCELKDDNYRRCSCSNRINELSVARDKLETATEQLNAFSDNLDIVGMTAAQAKSVNTASDGEMALSNDKSASQALLQAIMNSIRGDDATVSDNRFSDLNSINLSFDSSNAFGTIDVGQTVASYNGVELYSAVYPQCRQAVMNDCNTASLQRAVNAYLMAIEQDCNTVQTAINNKQKEAKAAVREGNAMLDLARIENRQKHNSDDIVDCLANVESAILSEEVCGKNYHKCLDNGEYIDVTTGKPIVGVVDFYKLGQMLQFRDGVTNENQKLAQNQKNRIFVESFEKRVRQFAEPALDKCSDDADEVWADYLDKALLDIYYAQKAKVSEIQRGCFDFVSACYMNGNDALTTAMRGLIDENTILLKPDMIKLNDSMCTDYIKSCNNMFSGNIVADYIDNRKDTDTMTACRAIARQCFDSYGGTNYENFYYPSSGLFAIGEAPDWFSLYEYKDGEKKLLSPCAKQVDSVDACKDMVEQVFGGFDKHLNFSNQRKYIYIPKNNEPDTDDEKYVSRNLRPSGVATEVYNNIVDILQTQCNTLDGRFLQPHFMPTGTNTGVSYDSSRFCLTDTNSNNLRKAYNIGASYMGGIKLIGVGIGMPKVNVATMGISSSSTSATMTLSDNNASAPRSVLIPTQKIPENMCPANYEKNVDTQSWGACLCWENGGRRSNNGTASRCVPTYPVRPSSFLYGSSMYSTYGLDKKCSDGFFAWGNTVSDASDVPSADDWCTLDVKNDNTVCPFGSVFDGIENCVYYVCDPGQVRVQTDSPLNSSDNSNFYCCPAGAPFINGNKRCSDKDGDEPSDITENLLDPQIAKKVDVFVGMVCSADTPVLVKTTGVVLPENGNIDVSNFGCCPRNTNFVNNDADNKCCYNTTEDCTNKAPVSLIQIQ